MATPHIKAEKGDFCFVEGESLLPYEEKIESIVLFKWNRDYPSDKKADIDLSNGWVLTQAEDFAGSSHEKKTMEIYKKPCKRCTTPCYKREHL